MNLEHQIEIVQKRARGSKHFGIFKQPADRGVVFVYKDDDFAVSTFNGLNQPSERTARIFFAGKIKRIRNSHVRQQRTKDASASCNVRGSDLRHVQSNYGIRFPVIIRLGNRKPPEQASIPLENLLERGNHQRLTESPRARHEEEPSVNARDHALQKRRLVDIDIPFPDECREVVCICNDRLHSPVLPLRHSRGTSCCSGDTSKHQWQTSRRRKRQAQGAFRAREPCLRSRLRGNRQCAGK